MHSLVTLSMRNSDSKKIDKRLAKFDASFFVWFQPEDDDGCQHPLPAATPRKRKSQAHKMKHRPIQSWPATVEEDSPTPEPINAPSPTPSSTRMTKKHNASMIKISQLKESVTKVSRRLSDTIASEFHRVASEALNKSESKVSDREERRAPEISKGSKHSNAGDLSYMGASAREMSFPAHKVKGPLREIGLKGLNLFAVDLFGKCSPVVVAQEKVKGVWHQIGETEVVMNDENPRFTTKLHLPVNGNHLKLVVYDSDAQKELKDARVIGEHELQSFHKLSRASDDKSLVLSHPSSKSRHKKLQKKRSTLTMHLYPLVLDSDDDSDESSEDSSGEEEEPDDYVDDGVTEGSDLRKVAEFKPFVRCVAECRDLIKPDFLSKCSAILVASEQVAGEKNKWSEVSRTECVPSNPNPTFRTTLNLKRYSDDAKIKFSVYHKQVKGDAIGHTYSLSLFSFVCVSCSTASGCTAAHTWVHVLILNAL